MMSEKKTDLLEVGVISGTHGLRGDLKIRTLPTGHLALPDARVVYIMDSEGMLTCYNSVRATPHKQYILLRLSGLENIDLVKHMIGLSIFVEKKNLPDLDDDQHYWSDFEGLDVVDYREGVIGKVVGMFSTPAHDILEVEGPRGEILIPALEPFLVELDLEGGVLNVDLPDGLVPETE